MAIITAILEYGSETPQKNNVKQNENYGIIQEPY
jgi:hypothetical protein